MPTSSADVLIRRTIRALWKERDRITDQIAALSRLGVHTVNRQSNPRKGHKLKIVRRKKT